MFLLILVLFSLVLGLVGFSLGLVGLISLLSDITKNLIVLFKGSGLKPYGYFSPSPWKGLPLLGTFENFSDALYTQPNETTIKYRFALIYYILHEMIFLIPDVAVIAIGVIFIYIFGGALLSTVGII